MAVTPTRPTALVRLADWSYRRRRAAVAAWIALLIGSVVLSGAFGGENHFEFMTPGSESTRAQKLLESSFPARSGEEIQVVFHAERGIADPPTQDAMRTALDRLSKTP